MPSTTARSAKSGAMPALSRNCDASTTQRGEVSQVACPNGGRTTSSRGKSGSSDRPPVGGHPVLDRQEVLMRRVFSVLLLCALALVAPLGSGVATAAKSPKRIVSLSPTATEMLFAIGAGKQVVAVDDQSDYPKKAPHTKLSGIDVNVEAIARYNPALVVASDET